MDTITAKELIASHCFGDFENNSHGTAWIDGKKVEFSSHIKDHLYLSNASIESFPPSMCIEGDLIVSGAFAAPSCPTPYIILPRQLIVEGDLMMSGAAIQELPFRLKVGSDLYCSRTLKFISPQAQLGGAINLAYSKIQRLPDNWHVYGDLILSYSSLKELPKGLTVDGYIFLTHTAIKRLPTDLQLAPSSKIICSKNQFLWTPKKLKKHLVRK